MNSEDTVRRLQKYQRNIEKTKRSKKMTIKDVITKVSIFSSSYNPVST